ncbi:MAG: hypothetical protein AAF726_20505 [Planctomycetota bacterium]
MQLGDPRDGSAVDVSVSAEGVRWESSRGRFRLDADRAFDTQLTPPGAAGLLASLWVQRTLLAEGAGGVDAAYALGALPWEADGEAAPVLRVEHRGAVVDLFFDPASGRPIGVETSLDATRDAVRLGVSAGSPDAPGRPETTGFQPARSTEQRSNNGPC